MFLIGNIWAFAVYRLFLVDVGLSNSEIFVMLDVVGVLVGALGALIGGYFLQKYTRKAVFVFSGILLIVCLCAYLLPFKGFFDIRILYFAAIANKFAGGVAGAALFTVMMDQCRAEYAGTDFTIQQSIFNLATITAAFSGSVAVWLGYAGLFVVCIVLAIVGFLWVVYKLPVSIPTSQESDV